LVADLDRIPEPLRQGFEERVEPGHEVGARGERELVRGAELEDEGTDPIPIPF
jgi:hypothetical protein